MNLSHRRHRTAPGTVARISAAALSVAMAVTVIPAVHAAQGAFTMTCTLDHVDASGDGVWRLAASGAPGGTYRVDFGVGFVFYGSGYRADKYVTFMTDYSGDRMSGKSLVGQAQNRKGSVIAETPSATCG